MSSLLTVLAGYFTGQSVPETTVLWVDALRKHSHWMVLVFDNAPPKIWPQHWIDDANITLQCEPHGEYDFGSYKRGMAAARAQGWHGSTTHLLLTNDSVIGPLAPLEPVLSCMQANDDEAWGLTQSDQMTPHLQSYFLIFGKKVFENPAVQAFFDGIKRQETRHAVIEKYEMGLSRVLLEAGLTLKAWLTAEDCLDPRNGERMGNPTSFPCALVHQGVPVIKTKAFRDPSANNDSLGQTTKLVAQRNLDLWKALWKSTRHRRLWQDAQSVTVLLQSKERDQLNEWIKWMDLLPHKNCRVMFTIPLSDPAGRAQILNRYRSWIESSRLLIHSYDQAFYQVSGAVNLISAIAVSDSEWFCIGSPNLLQKPSSLIVQLRRATEQPLCDLWKGGPVLARRLFLLSAGNLHALGVN